MRCTNCHCARQSLPSMFGNSAQNREGACNSAGTSLATIVSGEPALECQLSLDGILSSALSALHTNQAALRVVSNNIANMNTPGYTRRVINEQPLVMGGQVAGVDIADIQRVTDRFLTQEVLASN